ncbi:Z-ring formation inhibitor MciZ [Cytobacillus sp. FJAT-54145]|uniref:Z-ring formation inhibitor MciZ n=1 Tax=Cytobacillus spartinae TaxID=3299023 RepID=A0ABW6KIC4_9BACI
MKIYIHSKGITMAGKAWEIRTKLQEYQQHYDLLKDWVENTQSPPNNIHPIRTTKKV